MRILANNYRADEIFKFIREYTGKTQKEFGKSINRSKTAIQLEIAKKENLNIIIDSKK